MKSLLGKSMWIAVYIFGVAYRIWVNVASAVVDTLGLPEEGVKSILREIVALSYRCVNGVSAIFVAVLVDRSYWRSHRRAWSDMDTGNAGRNWTHSIQSTLNAVVAREVSVKGQETRLEDTGPKSAEQHSCPDMLAPPLPSHVSQVQGHSNTQLFCMPYKLAAVSYDRGVLQESIMHLEIFVTRLFDALRMLLRSLLLLPPSKPVRSPSVTVYQRRSSFHEMKHVSSMRSCAMDQPIPHLHRSKSTGAVDEVPRKQQEQASGVVSAAALIRTCGYPAEEHMVTTSDGYRLRMDRIPRHNCRRCVLFIHGVLDTSLSWVCSGVTESQAFAAWDDGCDVWLANCRSNPPRQHVDPAFQGPAYWHYTVNELGLHDLHAQIEHLHNVKCRELGAGVMTMPRTAMGVRHPHQARRSPRRTRASEDSPSARQSCMSGSWTGVGASQKPCNPPLRGSWRARAASAAGQHASDSDLASLWATGEPLDAMRHSTVMNSGLFQTSAAITPRNTSSSVPKVSICGKLNSSRLSGSSGSVPASARHQEAYVREAASTSGGEAVGSDSPRPRVDSYSTPFEELPVVESRPCTATSNTHDSTQGALPSPPSPGTPPLSAVDPGGSGKSEALIGEKSSIFTWLPRHATGVEQEALQLGVERTGPFFHNVVNEPTLEDVVEINISGCRLGDSLTARSLLGPRGTPQRDPSSQDWSTAGLLKAGVPDSGHDKGSGPACSRSGSPVAADASAAEIHASSSAARRTGHSSACCNAVRLQHPHPMVHEPYTLTAVGHSLGGAALLIYIVQFRRTQRRHRLSRLVLLTPAGFMERIPSVVRPIAFILPASLRLVTWMFPAVVSLPFYLPSSILRSLMFRLTADVSSMPALTRLVRAWAALCTNGDRSEWDQAMRMPHYNKTSMPAVSLLQAKHMLQWFKTGRFAMFDYGSRDLNLAAYGQSTPVDIAAEYWRIDVPVDFAAGKYDGIISPQCVKKHRNHMIAAGVKHVTYREFEFGHLDFTFSAKQDLRHHILSCIQ